MLGTWHATKNIIHTGVFEYWNLKSLSYMLCKLWLYTYFNFMFTIKPSRLDRACAVNVEECGACSVPGTLSMQRGASLGDAVYDDYIGLFNFLSVSPTTTTAIIRVHAVMHVACGAAAIMRAHAKFACGYIWKHFYDFVERTGVVLSARDFSILKLQNYADRLRFKYSTTVSIRHARLLMRYLMTLSVYYTECRHEYTVFITAHLNNVERSCTTYTDNTGADKICSIRSAVSKCNHAHGPNGSTARQRRRRRRKSPQIGVQRRVAFWMCVQFSNVYLMFRLVARKCVYSMITHIASTRTQQHTSGIELICI